MWRSILFLVLISMTLDGYAQIGGQRAFEFLNVPNNARLTALGGTNITSGWDDLSQMNSNPALINELWKQQLAVGYLGYFADVNQTSVSYANQFKSAGLLAINLTYFNYGEFDAYDAQGNYIGQQRAKDYALSIGKSISFGAFTAGANGKIVVSDLAGFQASALMLDLGGTFKHPEKDLTVGMSIKNLGFLVSDFEDNTGSKLPLDVQLGFSYKPEFMPFRFSLTTKNTLREDLVYFDQISTGFGQEDAPSVGEEIFRRLVLATELLLSPNLAFRVSYNHLLRQELKLENAAGGAGFSFGLMFKVKRFEFAYSRALYHVAGGSNFFQVMINTNELIKRDK